MNWFCHPKRSSGAACCRLAFYSSVNNGLYILSSKITEEKKKPWIKISA